MAPARSHARDGVRSLGQDAQGLGGIRTSPSSGRGDSDGLADGRLLLGPLGRVGHSGGTGTGFRNQSVDITAQTAAEDRYEFALGPAVVRQCESERHVPAHLARIRQDRRRGGRGLGESSGHEISP
ncbi:hypothetical protein ACL02R_01440 [Streptomyces sp. MS19]|uniref:hypothetical protein n=1 Tax=Streptomyces sp. MS19 TaxID=3385972 RepID=UPI0039A2BED5